MVSHPTKQLFYYIESASKVFSLHPLDVDSLSNDVLMRALVGTLLRTDGAHRRIPNLAESWETTEDHKIWIFKLCQGLTCQNNQLITAPRFVKAMNLLMKLRAKSNPTVTAFSELRGWSEFVGSKVEFIPGLTALDERTIQFEFDQPMDSGFLAFLSIPQFGYYCEANFSPSGEWIGDIRFVASGAYALDSLSENKQVAKILRRGGWPIPHLGQPEKVDLHIVDKVNFATLPSNNTFVVRSSVQTEVMPQKFYQMNGAMTWLRSLVVSPFMNNFFKSAVNRRIFMNRLQVWARTHELKIPLTSPTETFYPNISLGSTLHSEGEYQLSSSGSGRKNSVIKLIYSAPDDVVNFYVQGIQTALKGSGLKLEVHQLDRASKNGVQKFLSNRDYDLRLISSSIGGGLSN